MNTSQRMSARYFDGVHATPVQGMVGELNDRFIVFEGENSASGFRIIFNKKDCQTEGMLGLIRPVIYLANMQRIELQADHLPNWIEDGSERKNHLHILEKSVTVTLLCVVLLLLLLLGLARFVIPNMAERVAFGLNEKSLLQLGNQSELHLYAITAPSTLLPERQLAIQQLYARYIEPSHESRIKFRHATALGANAVALPNGKIVLTDELVDLSRNDMEIVAVLAHEYAHLVQRHSLQQLLSNLGLSLAVVWITGDVVDIVSSMPSALVNLNYARQFETQADNYAHTLMQKQHIPLHYFSDILQRLDGVKGHLNAQSPHINSQIGGDKWYTPMQRLLLDHPDTNERIAKFRQSK